MYDVRFTNERLEKFDDYIVGGAMLIIWCGLEVVTVEDTDELTNNSFN